MDDLYLGTDRWTSATKAVLVDGAGRVVARSSATHSDSRTASPGRVDPGPGGRRLEEGRAALGPEITRVTALCAAVHSPVALFLDSDRVPVGRGIGCEDTRLAGCCASAGALRTPAEADDEERAAIEIVDLPTLLRHSDVVSLHCPQTPETRHLIDADALRLMKPTALLVNTARGPVVDTGALVAALGSGEVGGAALDVFEDEPHVDPRLLGFEQVVLTPHLGGAADTTRSAMCQMSVGNALEVLAGRPPLTPVS